MLAMFTRWRNYSSGAGHSDRRGHRIWPARLSGGVMISKIMTVRHHWQQNRSEWWECEKCGEKSRYSGVLGRFVYKDRDFDDTCVVYYDNWEQLEGSK